MMDKIYITVGGVSCKETVALAAKSISPKDIFYYLRVNNRDKTLLNINDIPNVKDSKTNLDLISIWKKVNEKAFFHYLNYLDNKQQQNYRYAMQEVMANE